MINLMGDTELDLLVFPLIVTTLAVGQALDACIGWFRWHFRLRTNHVTLARPA